MSIARHHNEWLSLVPNSGPFLSLPVLMRVFPQGLPALDPELRKETRLMFEGWEDGKKDRAVRRSWCDFVLRSVLQFPAEVIAEGQTIPPGMEARMSEFGEVLRPDVAIIPPKGSNSIKPRLLVQFFHPDQDLEKPLRDRHWKASPATRMTELLHAADVPLGLITNGEHWMLVHAPRGETSGFASWYAPLWFEEPLTFQAFTALLSAQRFFGVAENDTIEALLTQSAQDQQEVTEQLGWQVRKAVEVLIQSLDKIDQDYKRQLLEGVGEKQLYEAALTVMMRLVFLFSAEERGLLLLGDPLYDQHYAVSTLRDQLQEIADKHVEEILDARFDAWSRLLATFRAVYGGVQHEAMRLPPYGGTLFDPDRFPFLEGRKPSTSWRNTPAEPIKVSNRTVLHLLNALQILQAKVPGSSAVEARRLSFRSLDIEQIGHVYEGLLDHTAKRASEPVLGLKGSKDKEPEIPLTKLEEMAVGKVADRASAPAETAEPFLLAAERPGNIISLPKAKGSSSYAPPEKLVEFIKEETGRSVGAIKRELTDQSGVDEGRLLLACGHDRTLLDRVWRFATLLRDDTFGFPVVIPSGSVYVTQGSDRRSTGTHYTPRSLTEPIVQHTLEPLVYIGPAEGTPREQWKLKSAREILELKVCDMAMGSGAFLVQTCRYLAERLVEAWENVEKEHPGCFVITPEGELSTGSPGERLLPKDPAERLTIARRFVADRCLYGVDINHMAVEMAKLSLWLITLQKDRPFTFLDHALRCGDSLLGVSSVKQIENFSLRAKEGERVQHTFATANLFRYVDEATEKRRALENLPSNDHTQIETKNRLHAEAEAATAKVKALADCLIAFELRGLDGAEYEDQRAVAADHAELAMRKPLAEFQAYAREQLRGRQTLQWAVSFPEVFARGGFDAFVGNPPFMGGKKITGAFGIDYRDWQVAHLAKGKAGVADLCAYFFLRAHSLLSPTLGIAGLVATNTIAQGDTREVGLDQICALGSDIFRAVASQPWPGDAALEVSHVWFCSARWRGESVLSGRRVSGINATLSERGQTAGQPRPLAQNSGKSHIGSYVLGAGFLLTESEVASLLSSSQKNKMVIFRYLIGEEINASPSQSPQRWVINFADWPLDRTATGEWKNADEALRTAWLRSGHVPCDYPYPVATDFPDCLSILRERVKPERDKNNRDAYRERWWRFAERQANAYETTRGFEKVLVRARTSRTHAPVFVENGLVFSEGVVVFALPAFAEFAVVQSSAHEAWAWQNSSTLKADLRYSPTDCFETFPFPRTLEGLERIGSLYHEFRHEIMLSRQEGLTKIYNRFLDRSEKSEDITRLRALHVEMDQAVAAAYGWTDLDLGHGFHETKQGVRYTISESARRTVLDRLLALNHQRYAEEVKAGLHDKGAKKGKRAKAKPSSAAPAAELLPGPQQDLFSERQ
jgi:hypothetical protein